MHLSKDEVQILINDVEMKVKRLTTLGVPAEVTAIIPRAEIRHRLYRNGKLAEERETILNSITIAHSPRHPEHASQGSRQAGKKSRPSLKYIFK